MKDKLPDIRIFDYHEKEDVFLAGEDYRYIADTLGLTEWNSVVWIGRLFAMDNDFGEHWFDNWDEAEEENAVRERLGNPDAQALRIDPARFQDGRDGPCNTDAFRKRFWTDVLRSLELNLGTLIEKARQQNERYQKTEGLEEFQIVDLEDRITSLLKTYAPGHPQLVNRISDKVGLERKLIEEIASELDAGMICYVHKETKEMKSVIDPDNWLGAELDPWADILDEVEENYDQYWRFEPMSSTESFRLMEQFADQVDDENLKDKLFRALDKRKPFRNFKFVVDNSGEYRQKWFEFKDRKYQEYVVDQLEAYIQDIGDE